jgi:hypothetical protein
MSYKLGIVGSRVWTSKAGQIWNPKITNPREFVFKKMDQYVAKHGKPSIVYSGGAKGADKYGVEWAESRGIKFKEYKPDGPESAEVLMNEGYIPALFHRNTLVVKASDRIVAFWDRKSRGTKNTLDKAWKSKPKKFDPERDLFNVG